MLGQNMTKIDKHIQMFTSTSWLGNGAELVIDIEEGFNFQDKCIINLSKKYKGDEKTQFPFFTVMYYNGVLTLSGGFGYGVFNWHNPKNSIEWMANLRSEGYIIEKCNALGKPVITATQMLESMIHSPVPTRAEVSDIANAIYDGTDAVMLSEESTLGSFPLEAIEVMSRVAKTIEASEESESFLDENITTADTISEAVWKVSKDVGAAYIVALTESGSSAKMVSRFKPSAPIIALSPNEGTVKHLELSYGVKPFLIKKLSGIDESMTFIPAFLKAKKLGKKGDKVVVTAGVPFNVSGSTNLLFVLTL
jgi:hypothetical protein